MVVGLLALASAQVVLEGNKPGLIDARPRALDASRTVSPDAILP
jgi:hypothetical protein